jgi:uncharacterized repeat protein (TIGR01451 family)
VTGTVRIACVGLLLVAAAFITGGTSALATGDVTITVNQAGSPIASADAQGDFSLTVKATNNTGAPVNDTATLSLQLPAGVAPTSGCSGSSSPFSCDVPLVLAATDSDVMVGSIALHADPSSAGSFPSQAGSASTTGGLAIDPFAYDINVAGQADLGVALTAVPASTVAGGTGFTAKATVTNNGPSDSGSDWTASVTLPSSDLAFGTVPGVCSVDVTGLIATCNGSNLNPGGFAEFDLPVSAPHDAAAGANQITAAVQPGAVSEGANTNSDTDQATVHVVTQADLGIAWSGLPTLNQVAGQDSFTPTATVTNSGPSDSGSGWSAKLTLPTGFAFHAAPSGCTLSVANTIATCSGQNLDPTSSSTDHRDFSATVDVLHNAPIGNDGIEAKVTPGINEGTDAASDDDVQTVPVVALADLGVALTGVPTTSQIAGQDSFTATINVTNHGPSDSAGWSAALTIPSGLALDTSVALPGACSPSGAVVICTGSNIDPTAVTPTVQFPIQVKVLHDATVADHTLNASVAPSLDQGANTAADSVSVPVHVITQADLALSVSTTPGPGASSPYVAGDTTKGAFSYVYTVTNNGPSDHNGDFTVTDTLPAGFVFQSGAGCGAIGQVVTCTDSSVLDPTSPTGKSHVFTVGIKVDHTVADNSYSDNASVATGPTAATPEPPGAPNNNSASTSVSVITKADLVITGTGDGASRSPALIFANGTTGQNTVTFTVTFHNGGPSDARHSTLKFNPLSSHLGGADWCLVTVTVACGPTDTFTTYNGTAGIDAGKLAPGVSATVVLHAHALSSDRNGPFNVAQGFAVSLPLPTTDDTSGNNTTAGPSVEIDTVSSPPQNLQAVPGNGNAIVTWRQPSNLGGPTRTIIDYSVTVTPSVAGSPFTVSAGATKVACPNLATNDCYQLNVPGLTNNTHYTFDVRARNQVGTSDPASATAKPSTNAAATLVPAAGSTLSTCTVATSTQPVCVSFTVPGGGSGGVFGTLGGPDVGLPGGFCAGICSGTTASSGIGPLSGYNDRKKPIKETILWDSTTIPASALKANSCGANKTIITCYPNNVTFYDESSASLAAGLPSTAMNAPGSIHFCADPLNKGGAGNAAWARPTPYTDSAGSACIASMSVLTGQPGRGGDKGDVRVVLNFTSDSDIAQGRH